MLKPGRMLLVDMEQGRLIKDREIKSRVCREKPYRRWLEKNRIELRGLFSAADAAEAGVDSSLLSDYFHYDEEAARILKPMLLMGQEAISAMGTRKPPAALARKPVPLYSYFHQLFAQVTNPPIDPYRENLVMSLENYIGKERNLLDESPAHCRQLKLLHPLLSNTDVRRLRESRLPDFRVATVSMLFPADQTHNAGGAGGAGGPSGTRGLANFSEGAGAREPGAVLTAAIERICADAESRIDEGFSLIILSDRGIDAGQAAVPALLAASAVHGHLVAARKRHRAGLIVETGEAREVHQIAVLLGCGASGVNPWMVFERMPELLAAATTAASAATAPVAAAVPAAANSAAAAALVPTPSVENVSDNYIEAVKKGILKSFRNSAYPPYPPTGEPDSSRSPAYRKNSCGNTSRAPKAGSEASASARSRPRSRKTMGASSAQGRPGQGEAPAGESPPREALARRSQQWRG